MLNFIKRDDQWTAKAKEVFELQQQRKLWEERESKAIEELKELTGDLNSMGGGFKYEVTIRAGSVDYKAIPQLKGVNLDIYRKEGVRVWKLSYVGSLTEEVQ